ncbi:thiolase family protein [Actinomadura sp. DC4]|uniref:thiolase family protein n=1 Tax=Actinomadura sp. DC4 TaxID=3055069 RepID=UPI0025AED3C3|nr:thiolase family protein [Actinomadura sp. DC4]MDN3356341.1 thiolase family protein [Actinomadura sp. DC4]
MRDIVIVEAIRTPMGRGKAGGALSSVHPVDLLAQVFLRLMERTGIDPGQVDDVLVGCVSQVGEQSATPGRFAWLGAGLPVHVPSTTIERKCGSGQQAIEFAAQGIAAGAYDVCVAAGVESMSRVPMGSGRLSSDPFGEFAAARFPGLVPQGVSAELIAAKWNIGRERQDEYSLRSHQRAHATAAGGGFATEIVAVTAADGRAVTEDETIRPDTTLERLAGLRAAFETEELRARHPEARWTVTAGNASQITDGAAALLLMEAGRAESLGLRPRARIVGSAVCADDPVLMLTAPIPATRKVLGRTGMSLDQMDAIEVNEAFASVPLAWQAEFGVDEDRLNPRGGAIALGHPLGASGCRLMTTLINQLEATGGRYGLQTMCEAGGMANATVIERLG